ncbi:MAG: methylmalonyl Co-A mutase-associated GTPase MeaB [Syntrophomonadaceae bacterium]
MSIAEAILSGDIKALAKVISKLENSHPEGWEVLRSLYNRVGQAAIIGITGAPGVGKSTLVSGIARVYLEKGFKVAILAVDPSSPFTGGSILGDRIRMQHTSPNLYYRSLASRGHLGGLSVSAGSIINLLDASGYQRIIVETIGTGQGEVEIRDYAHTVIVVNAPNLGDDIQAMKAGILEIGDIFVVNKSDLPGADMAVAELNDMLGLRKTKDADWQIPVIPVTARSGKGIKELVDCIEKHYGYLAAQNRLLAFRKKIVEREIRQGLINLLWNQALACLKTDGLWDQTCEKVARAELDPQSAINQLFKRIAKITD